MVKKIKMSVVLMTVFLLSLSCQREMYPVDMAGFTYRNRLVFNNQIKIDGMYIRDMRLAESYIVVIYFYPNGTYCSFGTENFNTNIDENSSVCYNIDRLRSIPYYWGMYIIEGDTIKVQSVNPHRDAFQKFKIEEKWAKILNDSTIHFFKYISPKGEVRTLDELCHFEKCLNKPDSTNVLLQTCKTTTEN